MAYLLRFLLIVMLAAVLLTIFCATRLIALPWSHIYIAIPTFLYTIFAQAFIMFYFIGISRLTKNVHEILISKTNLEEIFETPPEDFTPYLKKVKKFVSDANLAKRKTIPWTMIILVLGMLAFFMGAAHDTGLVQKYYHSGIVYGFFSALLIGFYYQWKYLGKGHALLRKLKTLFQIPDAQM